MITAHTIEPTTQTEPATPPPPRAAIIARIRAAQMPQVTKKLASKLLERNLLLGDTFHLTFGVLRQMCHGTNNIEVTKHLRRMREKGIITYTIDFQSQQVALTFVVGDAKETIEAQR